MILTDAQVKVAADHVSSTGSSRYTKDQYLAVITRVVKSGKGEGRLESEFPGVKPANVHYQLKQLRGDTKVQVGWDKKKDGLGVFVLPA